MYNWIVNCICDHAAHSTSHRGHKYITPTTVLGISASIFQDPRDLRPMSSLPEICRLSLTASGSVSTCIPDHTSNQRQHTVTHTQRTESAQANNLTLNQAKCVEIVFAEHKRRQQVNQPPSLSWCIVRASYIKITGVTLSNSCSTRRERRHIIHNNVSCAQTVHALRARGVTNSTLHTDGLPISCLLLPSWFICRHA